MTSNLFEVRNTARWISQKWKFHTTLITEKLAVKGVIAQYWYSAYSALEQSGINRPWLAGFRFRFRGEGKANAANSRVDSMATKLGARK